MRVVRIRTAGLEDLEAVSKVEGACFDSERYPVTVLRAMLSEEGFTTFVAEEDGAIGSATLHHRPGASVAQVVSLGVVPSHRHRGVATELLRTLEDLAKRSGTRRMVLQVGVLNVPAINLYLHHGYVLRGTIRDYYGPGKDAYYMMKRL